MSTIREIAEQTKLSIGTVSIVLNGRGDEMRISKKTQQRIIDAAQGLGYLPNVSARRLRLANRRNIPYIATFWPSDLSSELLGRFIKGVQNSMLGHGTEFEMTVHPYKRNDIASIREICSRGSYHGAVLTGISADEQRELEEDPLNIPLVLFNRMSTVHSCVHVDTYEIGRQTARLFASRGHKRVGTIVPVHLMKTENNLRYKGFAESCLAYGLELNPHHVQKAPMTMEGGHIAAKSILEASSSNELPTAMFFPLGSMAVSALSVFNRAGIEIPDHMEVLTYGGHEAEMYTVPSLSTVKLLVEEMAEACIRLVIERILDTTIEPRALTFDTPFIFRESCGGFKDS